MATLTANFCVSGSSPSVKSTDEATAQATSETVAAPAPAAPAFFVGPCGVVCCHCSKLLLDARQREREHLEQIAVNDAVAYQNAVVAHDAAFAAAAQAAAFAASFADADDDDDDDDGMDDDDDSELAKARAEMLRLEFNARASAMRARSCR